MRYGESRSLVIPRHRADPPPGRRAYELRRDDAGTLDRFAVHRAALRIGAEAVGDVSEDLRRRSNLDLFERRQSARAERFLAGGDEILNAQDLGNLRPVPDELAVVDEEVTDGRVSRALSRVEGDGAEELVDQRLQRGARVSRGHGAILAGTSGHFGPDRPRAPSGR